MNIDRVQSVLIEAGLRGHLQIQGALHAAEPNWLEGECALGVLHLALHANRREAMGCVGMYEHIEEAYGFGPLDRARIYTLNDCRNLDFIGIARKLEETTP